MLTYLENLLIFTISITQPKHIFSLLSVIRTL